MVQIEGETFIMGSDKPIITADGEGPARHVTVKTFFMDVHEVSNAEFRRFVVATGYVTEVNIYSAVTGIQITTGIDVNGKDNLPKLWEYCPSTEDTWAIFLQLRGKNLHD